MHLSRNEVQTGERYDDWASVVCIVEEFKPPAGRIAGWVQLQHSRRPPPGRHARREVEQAILTIGQNEPSAGLPRAVA